jgi:CheY-like chemotaxis protein
MLAAPPDLILMDIRMPVMSGLEAMQRIQQIPNLSMIPIVAVSAGVTQNKQAACIAAGAKSILDEANRYPLHAAGAWQAPRVDVDARERSTNDIGY